MFTAILHLVDLAVATATDRFKVLFQFKFSNDTIIFLNFQVSIRHNGYVQTTTYTELHGKSNKLMVSNTIAFDIDSQAFEK